MKFSNVIGQHALKKQLIQTVKENSVSHAQIFAGKEGYRRIAVGIGLCSIY